MKKIVSYFLSILMSVFFVISIFFITMSNTILDYNFTIKVLGDNDYYTLMDTKIKSNFEGYIKQSGLDESVLENIYSKEKLKEDMRIVIKNMYEQEQKTINVDIIKENLENNINKYLSDNSIKLKSNEEKYIEDFINQLVDIYNNEVSHPIYLEAAKTGITKISNIVYKYNTMSYGIFLSLLFIVVVINAKNKYTALKHVAISLLTSGFFILFAILIINLKINIDNILILNSNFSLIVISIIKSIINRFIYIGLIISCISIAMLILCNMKTINAKE